MTELTKILGKSYEKLKKNLQSQLSYLKLAIRSTNTKNTSFYAKPVRKKKLIKTSAVFNTPWRIQCEINNGMCCLLTPSIVPAAVNGNIIHIFQVELAM